MGRARAIRSQGSSKVTKEKAMQASQDYQMALRLSASKDFDYEDEDDDEDVTNEEREQDGARRNPYAAWEWGTTLRWAGQYDQAGRIHLLASEYFEDIGDKARSVIAQIDAGIDYASSSTADQSKAKSILSNAIQRTTRVEGRDISLLQRVIAKEGEGRMALASLLWSTGDRIDAESQLSEACMRLDQLQADARSRMQGTGVGKKGDGSVQQPERLKFTIDDGVAALEMDCSRFKNSDFLTSRLEWPQSLQDKVYKLETLGRWMDEE